MEGTSYIMVVSDEYPPNMASVVWKLIYLDMNL